MTELTELERVRTHFAAGMISVQDIAVLNREIMRADNLVSKSTQLSSAALRHRERAAMLCGFALACLVLSVPGWAWLIIEALG